MPAGSILPAPPLRRIRRATSAARQTAEAAFAGRRAGLPRHPWETRVRPPGSRRHWDPWRRQTGHMARPQKSRMLTGTGSWAVAQLKRISDERRNVATLGTEPGDQRSDMRIIVASRRRLDRDCQRLADFASRKHGVDRRVVAQHAVVNRANDTNPIHLPGDEGQMFADGHAGHVRMNRREFPANGFVAVGLHVESVGLADTSGLKQKEARFDARPRRGCSRSPARQNAQEAGGEERDSTPLQKLAPRQVLLYIRAKVVATVR